MQAGMLIIYNKITGKILNHALHESTSLADDTRPNSVGVLHLPYGYNENNFRRAVLFHIDPLSTEEDDLVERIIIEQYEVVTETEEQKRIRELEDQLLLMADAETGGIL